MSRNLCARCRKICKQMCRKADFAGILTYVKEFVCKMPENMQADVPQSRQAVFVRCCLYYITGTARLQIPILNPPLFIFCIGAPCLCRENRRRRHAVYIRQVFQNSFEARRITSAPDSYAAKTGSGDTPPAKKMQDFWSVVAYHEKK